MTRGEARRDSFPREAKARDLPMTEASSMQARLSMTVLLGYHVSPVAGKQASAS